MNKTAIRNFAEWAREKLIEDIKYKAGTVGITDNGIAEKLPQSTSDTYFYDVGTKDYTKISGIEIKQRDALVKAIQTKERSYKSYQEAFENVIEEVAYTWFNRLIAIRFMEVNDYLPSGVRVLSSENKAKKEPDLVTMPFDTDLEFTSCEQDRILRLKDDNKLDELFRMLFIKQCNKLHDILPELFEKTDDYSELLLTISFTDPDGIIQHLVNDIEDADFRINDEMYSDEGKIKADGQVEIIGWLYQYYISKKHDEIVNIYKGTVKKADIPAATQLFTTDWVVRYMVDNSLGRYWLERNPRSKLAEKLEFFVTPKNGEIQYVNEKINPTELTFFDPCMGSGHILVYAFDVLMEIYREAGYSDRDAALSIVENNLFGMDIDKRAYQLAYFAVMMKTRSYNRRALTKGISNNLAVAEESNAIDKFVCNGLTTDIEKNKIGEYLIKTYRDAQEIGTLQTVEKRDYDGFAAYLKEIESSAGQLDFLTTIWLNDILPQMLQLTKQAEIMSRKYAVVCTNPPYMNKLEGQLKKFVLDNFKAYSGDLFSVFMYRNFDYCKAGGYSAFMTPNVWMAAKQYENLRRYIYETKGIEVFVQMAKGAFFKEATVDICAFVLRNYYSKRNGLYIRLDRYKGDMELQRKKVIEAISCGECHYFYEVNGSDFSQVPGSPLAYWLSNKGLLAYNKGILGKYVVTKQGFKTGNNNLFLRLWYEVSVDSMYIGEDKETKKWFPCNKGGNYRKWYGNKEYVVNWENNGYMIINYRDDKGKQLSRPQNIDYNFKQALTWSTLSSGPISFRYSDKNMMFESKGSECFVNNQKASIYSVQGFLNSFVCMYYLEALAPTVDYSEGAILKLPYISHDSQDVDTLVKQNIGLSRCDWDSFETSWDFKKHPLVSYSTNKISTAFEMWSKECDERFKQLKANEEELNRIFIDIYGLQDELTPEVEDKDVSVRQADLQKDIKSLISYAVGCMFGRYSLDEDGLAYAGGEWDDRKYETFIPDKDNCLPITDEEYFEDDIVGLFCAWLKRVYGEDTFEENLNFIANALGNKGKTSREVIRNYFLTDFIKDHAKTYQKRPIYWLFDSGKQNGFKALVYIHRWNVDTIGNVRVEYLHRIQRVYEKEITRMQEIIDNSHDNKEISNATKRKEKLQKQIKETKDYDAKIAHLALSRIDIDLDDGVKVNYEKVQTTDGKKMQILSKI